MDTACIVCGTKDGLEGRQTMTETGSAPLSRKDIEAKIIALAWQDDDFRSKFVADPKGQFEERLGGKSPPTQKISPHEETDNSLHFVTPAKPKATISELSDQELERVAGGATE